MIEQQPQESFQSKSKIYKALIAAQKKVEDVAKSKAVPDQFGRLKYKVAEGEDIIEAGTKALNDAGLGVLQLSWPLDLSSRISDEKQTVYSITVSYLLFHEDGPEMILGPYPTSVIAERGKPYDKAEAAALTYNYSYFLRGLLGITRYEEPPNAGAKTPGEQGRKMGRTPDDRNDNDYMPVKGKTPQSIPPPKNEPSKPKFESPTIEFFKKNHKDLVKEALKVYSETFHVLPGPEVKGCEQWIVNYCQTQKLAAESQKKLAAV